MLLIQFNSSKRIQHDKTSQHDNCWLARYVLLSRFPNCLSFWDSMPWYKVLVPIGLRFKSLNLQLFPLIYASSIHLWSIWMFAYRSSIVAKVQFQPTIAHLCLTSWSESNLWATYQPLFINWAATEDTFTCTYPSCELACCITKHKQKLQQNVSIFTWAPHRESNNMWSVNTAWH